jgi:V/A-type H+-transporting ATPase subunit E|tara:strand:+ start:3738 stop:4298 length:561 start_codon:yes stop_codon:yes gene_type:complete
MMTLDALANEIAAQAKAQAAAIVSTAKTQAAQIEADAKAEALAAAEIQQARAERESAQLSVEVVASARQANQKQQLIARREELDATWNAAREQVGSADLSGRAGLLESLLAEAKSAGGDMVLLPVSIDRKALKSGGFTLGDDVDGLGGFVLESTDGSIVLDYRFDSRLEAAWKANLGAVNKALFGN